jgi:hypothetical protein
MASWAPEPDEHQFPPEGPDRRDKPLEGLTGPQVEPDEKPAKRIKATKAEWDKIRAHFEHACCVSTGLPYQHLHHICFRKADSGDDLIENLAPMTLAAHDRFHRRAPGWERDAAAIRVYVLTSRERCVYAIEKIGWDRFSQRYPLLNESEGSPADGPRTASQTTGSSDSLSDCERFEEPVWRTRPAEFELDRPFESELSW